MMGFITREHEHLQTWAKDNQKKYQSFREGAEDSYFSVPEDSDCLVRYHFDTFPEMNTLLEQTFERNHGRDAKELAKICSIASFKLRNISETSDQKNVRNTSDVKIPDYIYTI